LEHGVIPDALTLNDRDVDYCEDLLRKGSKSFYAASRLFPEALQRPTAAIYAFCRVSDDAVDLSDDPASSLVALNGRLDRIYSDRPDDHPVDRAFSAVVKAYRIPKAIPAGLLEGYAWDVEGRPYEYFSEVVAYSARVASTVGVMMTLLMGRRDPDTLGRACDLGVAMQLTNIARDVGEDARNDRLYLPRTWMLAEGVDPDAWLAKPDFTPAVGRVTQRLLAAADMLYQRAEHGIPALPLEYQAAIMAARLIYADIGRVIANRRYDSVSGRAVVSTPRKVWLALRGLPRWQPWRPPLHIPVLHEARFLVDDL